MKDWAQLEPIVVPDAGYAAASSWTEMNRFALIAPNNLGASVAPSDAALSTVWSGAGSGVNVPGDSPTGSSGGVMNAGPTAGNSTPAGGQYRLPGGSAPAAPAGQLTAGITDAGWLSGQTNGAPTYPYPLDPATPPIGIPSVPAGFTAEGLPIGVQIVGQRYADSTVLAACAAYEAACPWSDRRPAL